MERAIIGELFRRLYFPGCRVYEMREKQTSMIEELSKFIDVWWTVYREYILTNMNGKEC